MVGPAGLAAVTATALWTALAFVAPVVATSNTAPLVVILAAGVVVALSHRGAGHRPLPFALLATAGSALLIFLTISWLLPGVPGFVSSHHPPIYTPVTRLVDPIGEFALFVLLAVALGAEVLRIRIRTRRAALRDQHSGHLAGPNEMVVERTLQRRRG